MFAVSRSLVGRLSAQCRSSGSRGVFAGRARAGHRLQQRTYAAGSAAAGMAYKVENLTLDRALPAADIVLDAFSYDDEYSMSRALGAPKEGFPIWMRGVYMPACSQHGAGSIVAVDAANSSELGGVLTLEDLNEDIEEVFKQASTAGGGAATDAAAAAAAPAPAPDAPPLTEEQKQKAEERTAAIAPLIGILDSCKEIFWREYAARGGSASDREQKTKGKIAYLGFLAVSSKHRRRQVGSTLVASSSERLAARGYELSVAFCTSHKSKALFAKQGFEYWGGERYRTFQFNGRTWFESLPDDEIAVMVKRIGGE